MDSIVSYLACLVIVIVMPVIGFLVLRLWDRWRIAANASKVAKNSRQQEEELRRPMIEEVEGYFGFPLSLTLVSLYRNIHLVSQCDFDVQFKDGRVCYISHFHPCNLATIHLISQSYPNCVGFFAIASDGGELEYVVDPIQQNPPVLQYDVENDTFEQVAETLIEFVDAVKSSQTKSS